MRRAFRKKLPVAISVDGVVYLLYPDKTRKKVTAALMRELSKK